MAYNIIYCAFRRRSWPYCHLCGSSKPSPSALFCRFLPPSGPRPSFSRFRFTYSLLSSRGSLCPFRIRIGDDVRLCRSFFISFSFSGVVSDYVTFVRIGFVLIGFVRLGVWGLVLFKLFRKSIGLYIFFIY